MYRIYVVGIDKENKSHMISTRDFEYYEDTTALIRHALERIMGAPLFCVPNRLFLKKLDDSELAGKYEFRSNSIETNTQDGCRFVYGWIQRDTFTSDDEYDDESDDESDDEDENSFDPHRAGFKLLLEYFMMTPEEQVKRHSDYAQLIASLISGHME